MDPSSNQLSRWSYRLMGPFALPSFARGGYSTALTIRFFTHVIGNFQTQATWSTGQKLTLNAHQIVEADFILFHQRNVSYGLDYQSELIFGECKSFRGENSEERNLITDAFEAADVERMKQLSIRFPGAILVFATMKQASDLSKAEVERIARLAAWGREYMHDRRQTRAPVILLTGLELFTPYSLHDVWHAVGGRHAELMRRNFNTDNLRILADLTQQVHLGMPSYNEWLRAKWENRNQRRQNALIRNSPQN